MKEEMRENLIDEGIWMRGVFMILFLIAYNIVEFLIFLVALFQFVAVLFTGRVNETVLRLGNNLCYLCIRSLPVPDLQFEPSPLSIFTLAR